MLKLIKLEMLKNNIAKYIWYTGISILSIAALTVALVFFLEFDDMEMAKDIVGISFFVEIMTSIVFLIFTSVMHSAFTINAYKNRAMELMFSYISGFSFAGSVLLPIVLTIISIVFAFIIISDIEKKDVV